MDREPPTVRLPRARPASVPAILVALIGFALGLFLGHPILGVLAALLVWYFLRSSD